MNIRTWASHFFPSCILVLTLMSSAVLAEDKPNVYTLERGIKEALANNWTLKAREDRINQTIDARNQARADFLPKLSTAYSYTRLGDVNESDTVTIAPGVVIPGRALNSKDNFQWRATVTQPIFTGFKLLSAYELARLGIDQSQLELDRTKLDLIQQVKEAYFGILKADKAMEVTQKAVESLESNVRVAQSFYKVGMIPVNDLLKAEVELANARQNLVKAKNATLFARASFNVVLSRPIQAPLDVEDVLGYKPERGDLEEYVREALERRPEITLVENSLLQTQQQIRLAKTGYYPDIILSADYIKEGSDADVSGDDFHDSSRWQAQAILSWNLWEWGKTHYSVHEKQELMNELLKTKAALEDSIRLELKEALLGLDEAEKNIPTTRQAVEQGEENLRVSEERYKAQVTTITEVLDAQTLLTQARTNYYNALYDHHLARARLERALGME